jgi:hypothetical protein
LSMASTMALGPLHKRMRAAMRANAAEKPWPPRS